MAILAISTLGPCPKVEIESTKTSKSEVLSPKQRLLKGEKFDLNRASRFELMALPGVGPRIADRIVELRKKRGFFSQVEDLLRVKGIGPKKLEKIAPFLDVVSVVDR